MNDLLYFVSNNPELPVEEAVEQFFETTLWSVLQEEYESMSDEEKDKLYVNIENMSNR